MTLDYDEFLDGVRRDAALPSEDAALLAVRATAADGLDDSARLCDYRADRYRAAGRADVDATRAASRGVRQGEADLRAPEGRFL